MTIPDRSKTELFEQMPIPKAVLQLSVPMVIAALVTVIYNLADTYFVGMLGDPVQNAAVTLAFPVMLAFFAVNNLFGVGTSSVMSRSLGAGNYEKVRTASACGFYGALLSGILFSLLCTVFHAPLLEVLGADDTTRQTTSDYMFWTVTCGAAPAILNAVQGQMVRSEGSALHASIGTMSGCILNILLDPIFILPWGLDLGAAGAGLATFLSNCAAVGYFLVLTRVKRGHTFICLNPRQLRSADRELVRGILAVGIPASIQNLLNVTGTTILTNFSAAYGASAVAAMGIAQKLHSVPIQVVMGFSSGIMPLVSYNYTCGNRTRMKRCVRFAGMVMVPVMAAVNLSYWLGAEALMGAFMDNAEIVAIGVPLLRGLCLAPTFLCIDFLGVNVFNALGMGRKSLLFAVLRKIVLEIPLLMVLNRLAPLYGLAYAQPIAELILAATALGMLHRIFVRSPDSPKFA